MVCSTLDLPEISPGSAHGVSSFRVFPVSRRTRPSPDASSPRAVRCRFALPVGWGHLLRLLRRRLQGVSPRVDRHRSLPVSRLRGLVPLMDFLVGPRPARTYRVAPAKTNGRWAPSRFRIVNDHQRDEERLLGRRTSINPLRGRCNMPPANTPGTPTEFESSSFDKVPQGRRTRTDRRTSRRRAGGAAIGELRMWLKSPRKWLPRTRG